MIITAYLLLRAVDQASAVLEKNGWCQGDAVDEEGRHCILGALRHGAELVSTNGELDANRIFDRLCELVELDLAGTPVFAWNDEDGRTLTDVLAVLARVRAGLAKVVVIDSATTANLPASA